MFSINHPLLYNIFIADIGSTNRKGTRNIKKNPCYSDPQGSPSGSETNLE